MGLESIRTARILQARRRRARRQGRAGPRLGRIAAGLLALLLALGGTALAVGYSRVTQDLPAVETLAELLDPPDGLLNTPTRLYDRSGQHLLLELSSPALDGQQTAWLRMDAPAGDPAYLPPALITATLAASDTQFWSHPGYTLDGLLDGRHPTLAQRLVTELLLAGEPPSTARALRERLLAYQATQRYGRVQILEWFINSADYGRLAYGADAAARVYFGHPATGLDLAEAAVLAAAAEQPALNPLDVPQAAVERQKYLLQDLLALRLVDPALVAKAASRPLSFRQDERSGQALQIGELHPQLAPAFAQLALQQAQVRIPYARLARGGLRIITSLDYELQQQAACARQAQARRLEQPSLPPDSGCAAARLLPALPPGSASPATLTGAAGSAALEVLLLDPVTGEVLALVGEPAQPAFLSPQGGLPGEIATLDAHASGSILTPWIYLTAFTRGFSPATLVWDLPQPSTGDTTGSAPAAAPAEAAGPVTVYRGPLRLRSALAIDAVRPADSVLAQIGAENVWRTAAQFGLRRPQGLPPNASTPAERGGDGTNAGTASSPAGSAIDSRQLFRPVTLLEAVQAYGVLANRGVLSGHMIEPPAERLPAAAQTIQPAAVLSVLDARGQALLDWRAAQTRPIITPELAYLLTNILSDDAARRPSLGHPNPTETGRPLAVKLGHSADGEWAIGYSPQLVIGVWAAGGAPEAGSPAGPGEAPALRAAGLWHALAQYSARRERFSEWEAPNGISTARVCDPSGMLPTRDCPNVVEEVFLSGSEPIQVDRMYRSIAINRESGRLATVYTPPDLVEERAFFIVPPEAADWARQAGYAVPPQVYDPVPGQPPSAPGAAITSPGMFAPLRGVVTISGRALAPGQADPPEQIAAGSQGSQPPPAGAAGGQPTGPAASPAAPAAELDFYRLQVGQGLNPQQWLQIGEDHTRPQPGGVLGAWDTGGLNGLYAIQLVAAAADGSVQRATLMVTVDNTPPAIEILSPGRGEEVLAAERERMVLLAQVEEDLGLAEVRLYLDGKLLGAFGQPPFAVSWIPAPGTHTFKVVAVDLAGNTGEAQVEYTVR
ncbi:MAG: transglycosylase domain-containing protein [Chloroflexota bacterium]